ncbi:MAG: type II toxin-antitoxin system YafQ family toxin [Hyphomicrobiales bacterium]|nr:type II toxin-antitoxin system YafQ family toxin [Hyphomicrobiales bacterium]
MERTTRFKRDYKTGNESTPPGDARSRLTCVLGTLVAYSPLPEKHRDHPLSGNWSGFRDCHVKPDLILVYEKPNADTLRLVRLGSHGELGF